MNYHHLESTCETHKDSDQIFYPNSGLVNFLTEFWNHIIIPQFFLALESKVNDQYLGIEKIQNGHDEAYDECIDKLICDIRFLFWKTLRMACENLNRIQS